MPLDTGSYADGFRAGGPEPQARRPRVTLDASLDIGAALKTARESLGLSIEEIAIETRVRARHLAAIETGDLDKLPSRPFTIGYVRAYAKALGVDADSTASRYRTDFPSPDDELHTPLGVRSSRRPTGRGGLLMSLAGVAVLAVIGWNVALHAMSLAPKRAPAVAAPHAIAVAHTNAVSGAPFTALAPLPAPPEATAPAPYITPVVGPDGAAATNTVAKPVDTSSQPFVAQGTIYGPTTGASSLIIQARKSISLEVRGPGGTVYFAHQLAAGEAYRVPALPDLTAEVSNPASAELFEGGVSKGLFTQPQTPLKTDG
ncbi:MAG TPA: helix-turn-helix domain-containing protein [Caulobacteraceae bacterium]|nr:helix-turn-helix domain-containing protein [Caulobacteraceae bacterium]